MDIELKRLHQVLTVVRTGSFSAAAEALHLTQPALSRSIAVLEERYGFRIFERGRSGATLTSIGQSVVAEAEDLLRKAESTDHNLKLISNGEAGDVSFGMGPLIASLVLSSLNLHFLHERPRLNLKAVSRSADILYQELMNDRIEILFCGSHQLDGRGNIVSEAVGEITLSLIVRSDHPLANRSSVELVETAEFPLLSGAEMAPRRGEHCAGTFVCDNYHILRENVLSSGAVWVSAPALVKKDIEEGRLVSLRLRDETIQERIEVFMVSRKDYQLSPVATAIRDHVRATLN